MGSISHGFLLKRGVFTTIDHRDAATILSTPDGPTGTGTLGINDHGAIVGVYESRDRIVRHFVRDRKGRFTIVDDPPRTSVAPQFSETTDINNRGRISGTTLTPTEADPVAGARGFLLREGVNGRFTPIDFPGAPKTFVTGLNDPGQIVGAYENPDARLGSPGAVAP